MALISKIPDVNNEFTPTANTLLEFFSQGKVGFYIPLYQRPYSWNTENVEQLMEDLLNGVHGITEDSEVVTFLGTVILCQEVNRRQNIQPLDIKALPTTIYNVIDGQQRISTIALVATRLYMKLHRLNIKLRNDDFFEDISLFIEEKMQGLTKFFCFELGGKSNPSEKPVIVRGNQDEWTVDGGDEKYQSQVSNYLALFIRSLGDGGVAIPDKRNRLGKNLYEMDAWLEKVFNAHTETATIHYPDAKQILSTIHEDLIWGYERPEYLEYINENDLGDGKFYILSSCVQVLTFIHYFFDRACLSVIVPSSENWAFDIFQSLNATGTPLTAIETFKPLVVNLVNNLGGFKNSKSEEHFEYVDKLFDKVNTANKKTKLTNEFLNVLKLMSEGRSQHNQFSEQRKWLNDTYSKKIRSSADREEFIHRMSNLARYWTNVLAFDSNLMVSFSGLNRLDSKRRVLSVLCVKYLNDSSHRMANTVLSRFYSMVLRGNEDADKEFADAAMALAAFFTLWRAADTNTGLDDVYRTLLQGDSEKGIPAFSWNGTHKDLTVENLKIYLKQCLINKSISTKNEWIKRAITNLNYKSAKTVCKFAVFVSSHDTIVDDEFPGLMKLGAEGYSDYLTIKMWESSDLKTLEHVAPRTRDENGWDESIYDNEEHELVGNLTLLPVNINSSAGNRSWKEKLIYYKHLAEEDIDKKSELAAHANHEGIELKEDTIELLCSAKHASHIKPIVDLSEEFEWNKEFISKRTERICDLLWDRIYTWLD